MEFENKISALLKKTALNGWIDVEDELPPEDEDSGTSDFLLISDGANIAIGAYCFDEKNWNSTCNSNPIYVKYWRFLPDSPEKILGIKRKITDKFLWKKMEV